MQTRKVRHDVIHLRRCKNFSVVIGHQRARLMLDGTDVALVERVKLSGQIYHLHREIVEAALSPQDLLSILQHYRNSAVAWREIGARVYDGGAQVRVAALTSDTRQVWPGSPAFRFHHVAVAAAPFTPEQLASPGRVPGRRRGRGGAAERSNVRHHPPYVVV